MNSRRWWWPFGRKETAVDPPDLASATYQVIEEERKLEEDKARSDRLDEIAVRAKVVRQRVDSFTADYERTFTRWSRRHG
jgi:hypothetical protein